jgi:uncharacterized OsmC-like protein
MPKVLRTFRLEVKQGHAWIADDPAGTGNGAVSGPCDLLLGARGSCIAMTLLLYSRRK